MDKHIDIESVDRDTGMAITIDPKDQKHLVFKTIVHSKCGEKHIDQGKFATFNHRKHLCLICNEYFYDNENERAVGVA